MSIVSGIGQRLYVNQYDLSGDIGSVADFRHSRNQQDVSILTDTAVRRLPLLKDGALSFSSFFDSVAGQSHPVLSALPQSGLVTWVLEPSIGGQAACMAANASDYSPARGQDGSLVLATTAQANGTGVQWGNLLVTAGRQVFASAAAGTSVDDYVPVFPTGALPSVHGIAVYLHVFAVGSGSATVHVQDSTDNVSFADVTGMVFTAATGPTSQRLVSASSTQAVNRYLRVNVTGTFTNLDCAVVACRYIAEYQA